MGASGWRSREWGSRDAGHGVLGVVEFRGSLGLIVHALYCYIILTTLLQRLIILNKDGPSSYLSP